MLLLSKSVWLICRSISLCFILTVSTALPMAGHFAILSRHVGPNVLLLAMFEIGLLGTPRNCHPGERSCNTSGQQSLPTRSCWILSRVAQCAWCACQRIKLQSTMTRCTYFKHTCVHLVEGLPMCLLQWILEITTIHMHNHETAGAWLLWICQFWQETQKCLHPDYSYLCKQKNT